MAHRIDTKVYVLDSRHRAWRIGSLLGTVMPGLHIPWRLFNDTKEFCQAIKDDPPAAAFVGWDDHIVETLDDLNVSDGGVTYFVTLLDPFHGPRLARQLDGYYVPASSIPYFFDHFVRDRLIKALSSKSNMVEFPTERRHDGHQ